MHSRTTASAVTLAIILAVFGASASSALAQEVQTGIVVSSNSGTPLLLDGIESEKLPINVLPGTRVCIPASRVYKSEGERFIFQQWSTGTNDQCVVASRPGTYRATYAHEVLLLIKSTAPGIQRSMWVTYGEPIQLTVPKTVADGDETRYSFQGWSDGETPFELTNTIAPVKPTALEVKWIREHHLQVDSTQSADLKGTGWYPEGTNLVLRAADTLAGDTDQDRWKFQQWETVSFPAAVLQNPQSAITAINIQMPYSLRAVYQKQYLVSAGSPIGTLKRDWVNEGQDVGLETPAVIDIVPDQERLVFKRWEGMEGLISPRINGKADRPIMVNATYDRQVMLKVNAPFGVSGDGWQKAGSVATVSVPGSVPQWLVLKSSLGAIGGYPAGQSTVQVLVNEPTVLTAMYRIEPDLLIIGLLLVVIVGAVLVFVQWRYGWLTAQLSKVRAWLQRLRERVRGVRAQPGAASMPKAVRSQQR